MLELESQGRPIAVSISWVRGRPQIEKGGCWRWQQMESEHNIYLFPYLSGKNHSAHHVLAVQRASYTVNPSLERLKTLHPLHELASYSMH